MKVYRYSIWIPSLFILQLCACTERETYLIPNGFKGQVNIIFNQAKGAVPKYENGRRVYEIPRNGILLTQFKLETGYINHAYYYIDIKNNRYPLKIFSADDETNTTEIGVFGDGTVGVRGNSVDPNALHYLEFYISDTKDIDSYFSQDYQKKFSEKIRELTTGDF